MKMQKATERMDMAGYDAGKKKKNRPRQGLVGQESQAGGYQCSPGEKQQ